jgi:hypothetical protein
MHELLPIASGLLLGALLGLLRPSLRLPVGAAAAVCLGLVATVVSGEFRVSWGFLSIDIPAAALAAVAGLLVVQRARQTTGLASNRVRHR